jgi:hypothetical protein
LRLVSPPQLPASLSQLSAAASFAAAASSSSGGGGGGSGISESNQQLPEPRVEDRLPEPKLRDGIHQLVYNLIIFLPMTEADITFCLFAWLA